MARCPSCSRELATGVRFCPWCACRVAVISQETTAMEQPPASTPAHPPAPSSAPSAPTPEEGRFVPGTVVAGRYRVAGLLGKGGMGEVYRATDLALGQPVALKFLPETLSHDDRAVARFYNEVRMARQVTHPNVCRVYDIGAAEGVHYISMEFVDGEDLSSLLRRIGRLPVDKALDTARRLCAGLAAAHEKGMLHRDLKPANVMIDGRGQVIVMDFGLAGLTEQLQADVRSGTPAYMSPEQLAGREVTVKSDIYALGLVLYELFTGKRAFDAASMMELMQLQERGKPASITSLVRDLDPAVERVILRCLQFDPAKRPTTAMAVAAGLPGGDPLAAALMAGETPSPELIAAAGETEGLPPGVAWAWLGGTLAGIVLIGILAVPYFVTYKVPMEVPPEALARDARHMLENFGYRARPGDQAWGLEYDGTYLSYLDGHKDAAAKRWRNPAAGQPPVVRFWYRESPQPMVANLGLNTVIDYTDPPSDISGMARLLMDPQGKLQRLEVVPAQVEPPAPPAPPFDWGSLFRASGLEQSQFHSTEAEWTPLANWDSRAAWTGKDTATGTDLRVEAAAWRGRPVFFRIIGPWTRAERSAPDAGFNSLTSLAIIYIALIASCLFAWRNYHAGRSDLRGAWSLAVLYFVSLAGGVALTTHHAVTLSEISVFWRLVARGAINAGVVWLFYVALEPWVRRRWPQVLVAWTRYTVKGVRDPLVGRGLLYGSALGCLWAGLSIVRTALRGPASGPIVEVLDPLSSVRLTLGAAMGALANSLLGPLLVLFLLFVLRLILRKEWAAAIACTLIVTALNTAGTAYPAADWPINCVQAALIVWVLLRFGLVAMIAGSALSDFLLGLPRTLDFSLWYAPMALLPLVMMAGVALYGFHVSLAGRPVFGGDPD